MVIGKVTCGGGGGGIYPEGIAELGHALWKINDRKLLVQPWE